MNGIIAIVERNLLNFSRDRTRLVFSLFMSVFFLFIFSFVMKGVGGTIEQPLSYLIAGVIIMTVFQQALNNSTEILTDLASGFMKEIIVSPVARWQLAIGQVLSSATIAVIQGIIVMGVSLFMGLQIDVIRALLMIAVMVVAGLTFGSLGLFLATISRNSSSFQIVTSIMMIPLSFLSGAYIPTVELPKFLNVIVYVNPLTYLTAIFRSVTLGTSSRLAVDLVRQGIAFDVGGFIIMPAASLAIVIVIGLFFFALCVQMFERADFSTVKVMSRRGGGPH
ncbi:ABC transporter permease [Gracilinema caldarium]|uniref:Transport permease protein n=1 Tax=Gracilinema caldarium (strain ATCC 51460 / DSM 7334 / H1) TaxID=744872 RepID=F8EY45_GRAC1|nr:ABC transporter permease [Gracilinema caldarium]AEJ20706.1 ABC-2 type transporter [Gracilinema caldarium DSM 7334]